MGTYQSFSSEQTKEFGAAIGRKILSEQAGELKKSHAIVFALEGNLGAGKTTFTQGLFQGLGIRARAISPTFVIMRRYAIPRARSVRFKNIFHFDAYRLKKAEDLAVLEFDRIIANPQNIVVVEWPERIESALPVGSVRFVFRYSKKEHERTIAFGPIKKKKITS